MKVGHLVRTKQIIRKWSEEDSYYLPDEVPEGVVGIVIEQSAFGWNILSGENTFKDIPTINLEVVSSVG